MAAALIAAIPILGVSTSSAAGGVTTAQLALMPLPATALGSAAAGLPLAQDSGTQLNQAAAQDSSGNGSGSVTAAQLAKLGRLTGYRLDYSYPGAAIVLGLRGLGGVQSDVDLYQLRRHVERALVLEGESRRDHRVGLGGGAFM